MLMMMGMSLPPVAVGHEIAMPPIQMLWEILEAFLSFVTHPEEMP